MVGCADATNITSPDRVDASPSASPLSGDLIEWIDNEINFLDDDGTPLRMVRDQEDATTVRLYEDGVHVTTFDLEWSGGEVTHVRFTDALTTFGGRATLAESPTITHVHGGGGGGGCLPEECVYPESIAIDDFCEAGEISAASGCGVLAIGAGAAVGHALASSAIAAATVKTPYAPMTFLSAFRSTRTAAAAVGAYAACMMH
jgi:hypothetical protein